MASPTWNLDELQQQMQSFLPPLDTSSLCCCRLVEASLAMHDHLDDCELRHLDCSANQASNDDPSDASCTTNDQAEATEIESDANAKRRKHREAMARLRRGWRTSIAALQQQEKQLQALLERTIVEPVSTKNGYEEEGGDLSPLETLRRSYRELVAEQLQLQNEHASLEAAHALRDKYDRLLERELVRIRVFHASTNDT